MRDNKIRNRKTFNKGTRGGENQPATVNSKKQEHEPIQAQPLEVKVIGGNFDRAFRAFRALVQKERILSIYKEKQGYEKPSVKRRRKINESKRKQLEFCTKGDCIHTHPKKDRK
jgi:small subunit ribosomal protein S21